MSSIKDILKAKWASLPKKAQYGVIGVGVVAVLILISQIFSAFS